MREVPTKTKTPFRVLSGNCVDLIKDVPGGSVDLILTDPPYNVLSSDVVGFESDFSFIDLEDEFLRVLKPNGALFTFASWQLWFNLYATWEKLKFRWEIIFRRNASNALPYKRRPVVCHEYGLVFSGSSKYYYAPFSLSEKGDPYNRGTAENFNRAHRTVINNAETGYSFENTTGVRKPVSVIDTRAKRTMAYDERTEHPTQKDLITVTKLLKCLCPLNGTVLDPFCGSGTTIEAAVRSRRYGIGFDIDSDWVDVARERGLQSGGFEK
jgi:site-specific DNA-methyltransferase (adenine-specific)